MLEASLRSRSGSVARRDRPCDDWTREDADLNTELNRITTNVSVYTPYREYTIATDPPSPTALGPTQMGVALAQEPPWSVVALALLVILAMGAHWWGRWMRRQAGS